MKKWFTLIELIIVIWIIAILIWSISFFRPKEEDQKIKFGKECSNYIFQEILNEKNNIEKNKTINSGWQVLSHLSWDIKPDAEKTWLNINSYYENNITITKKITNTNWFCLSENISYRNNYIIKPSDDFSINIQKNNISTTDTEILSVCTIEWNECIEISKINYNKASNKFEQKFCYSFNSETCDQWVP
jgi:hypothetical protein